MKYSFLAILALLLFSGASVSWSPDEIKSANTGDGIMYMSSTEQEALLYLNLVRLYPKKFWEYECADYKGDGLIGRSHPGNYIRSLKRELKYMKPVQVLTPDSALYETAKCFVQEQGKTKRTGHRRLKCESDYAGECISYGMDTGADVTLQLLFDVDIPTLGHRKLCLNPNMSKIGINSGSHKRYDTMAVLDFK